MVVVGDDVADDALVLLYLCFDAEDSSPYPDVMPKVPAFQGTVRCGKSVFSGDEPESALLRIPGIDGSAGMLSLQYDRLHLGFDLRKRRGPNGKRIGSRRLVQLVAELGPVRGFSR